jgi:transcription antitermination factor NusB
VSERRAEIDEVLGQLSRNWRVERIARVERTILRMAIYELKFREEIPARVIINEAIELAKRFGSADASAFVNGLLDSALNTLGIRK